VNILGVSAFYHDSAACLVRDGEIIAAAQEERFTRQKHDAGFPRNAIQYCLAEAGLSAGGLDCVAFYEKPFQKADRLFSTYLAVAPRGISSFLKAAPSWVKQKIWIKQLLRDELRFDGPILFPEHHESHAASAFFPSPFAEAAILTADGVGEWATTTVGRGASDRVELLRELRFPHSLGLLYSAFTYYLGFRVNSGEYKVMGLAPYGEPRFRDLILSEVLDLKSDGSLRLNLNHFDFLAGLTMTNRSFARVFGGPRREPESELTQRHFDVARSLQAVTEEAMLRMSHFAHEVSGSRNLCLAGGVALNCVANGRILREGPFEEIWIQPAAGDAGGALGAALLAWHQYENQPRRSTSDRDSQKASLLGPSYDAREFLQEQRIRHVQMQDPDLMPHVARLLEAGKIVGWFNGRAEFGPRALGNRSILADPRRATMRETLNRKIKFRESFRPFAPVVLRERVADYFDLKKPSPYMLLVARVNSAVERADGSPVDVPARLKSVHSAIPAVTHVDGSARVQTVDAEENPRLHRLLQEFEKITGCAVLVNTSFNVRGEPPVCTPEDAYGCFIGTEIDYLVLGDCIVDKREKPPFVGKKKPNSNWVRSISRNIDHSPRTLRRFGITVGIALLVLAYVLLLRHRTAAGVIGTAAVALIAAAALKPTLLKLLHRVWMTASRAIGFVMTAVILTIVFYVVLTPIGLLQRLLGRRPLDLAFVSGESTYWQVRSDKFETANYEKQF
jgi:carbamoyltransferase